MSLTQEAYLIRLISVLDQITATKDLRISWQLTFRLHQPLASTVLGLKARKDLHQNLEHRMIGDENLTWCHVCIILGNKPNWTIDEHLDKNSITGKLLKT